MLFWYFLLNLSLIWSIEGVLIPDSRLNLTEISYHDEPSEIYLGSPSIVRLPSGRLLASHDFFGSGYRSNPKTVSIFSSDDNGESWLFLSFIKNSYWTTLSVYNGSIYAIGTDSDTNGRIVIHRSNDEGQSWFYRGDDSGVILFDGKFATGATPIVLADQIIYRAVEYFPSPSKWPTDFQAAVISCDLRKAKKNQSNNDDEDPIMNRSNWKITPPVPFDRNWIPKSYPFVVAPGFLEGNIVIVANGSNDLRVLNILRFNSIPYANLAIILQLNLTNNSLFFVSLIEFPGGMSKFSIRYDPVTQNYYSFVNPVTSTIFPEQRNILSLSYSKDLLHWNILIDRLLYDDTGLSANDSLRYTGFHYVDWQFDSNRSSCIEWNCDGGPNMIYLIRTSYRGANSYHNSNRITFKQLINYRSIAMNNK